MSGARPSVAHRPAHRGRGLPAAALSGRAWSERLGSSQEDLACRISSSWRIGGVAGSPRMSGPSDARTRPECAPTCPGLGRGHPLRRGRGKANGGPRCGRAARPAAIGGALCRHAARAEGRALHLVGRDAAALAAGRGARRDARRAPMRPTAAALATGGRGGAAAHRRAGLLRGLDRDEAAEARDGGRLHRTHSGSTWSARRWPSRRRRTGCGRRGPSHLPRWCCSAASPRRARLPEPCRDRGGEGGGRGARRGACGRAAAAGPRRTWWRRA